MRLLQEERGISLVEVVASIVLLMIILLSGYYMFVQSAKTAKTSEDIIDATYIAQTEMEQLYSLSKDPTHDVLFEKDILNGTKYPKINFKRDVTTNLPFQELDDSGNFLYKYYLKVNNPPNTQIRLTYEDFIIGSSKLVRVIIRVYDKDGDVLKAQMETILDWGTMM